MAIDGGRQERNWLVKSSTRILGPFSVDEIAQMLLKKHISIIDEVRQSVGRWKYIREHAIFDKVVHQLRLEQENAIESTQTQTMTATSTTLTRTDVQGDELTPTPTPLPLARSDASSPFRDDIKDIQPVREKTLPASEGRGSGRSFGLEKDARFRERLGKSRKMARFAVFGLAVLIVAGLFLVQVRKGLRRDAGYEQLIEEALRWRGLQLYEKSLATYRKAVQIREPEPSVQSQMALVLIALDRQTTQGRRLLEKELQDERNGRNQVIDASLGIAISYVLEGSLREAEEALQKILVLEPQNFNARLNLALISLRKGDPREAERQLIELSHRAPSDPLLLLGRSVANLESGGRDPASVQALVSDIRSSLAKSSQFRQELLLMNAALLPPGDPALDGVVAEFLMQVMHQSGQYVRDLRLDWRVADWDLLERHCRAFTQREQNRPRVQAMQAVCLAEAGRDAESRRLFNEALAASPKDPLLLFTQANLLYCNGLRNEAYAVLNLRELSVLPSRDALVGRICFDQGDLACAEKSFRSVLTSGFDIGSLAGLAAVLQRQDRRAEAAGLIREGLEREPNYLPLLELREAREGGT